MALIRGPFNIQWGGNTILDIEEIDLEHTIDSEDFQTVQGATYEVDGPFKVTATITLLGSDIQTLAALLPQHFVANGQVMSTGETVQSAVGAIDVVPRSCDENLIQNNLDIISCANPGQVLRVVDARTKIEGMEMDNKLMRVMVKFVGEAASNQATIQFFKQGGIATVS